MRRIAAVAAAGVVVAGAASFVSQGGLAWALGGAGGPGPDLGTLFGKRMARAEAIVVLQGVVHDFRVDRGRVLSAVGGQLVLRELDGTVQSVPIAPDVRVRIDGQPASPAALTRGLYATAIRDGNAPAAFVQALSRGR